ncbi:MAG: hypothetical protein KatS3mg077_1585 [Candidatus Binatia bacterium]|nr:MAG: hypothetical protein KatS3mg077_1585 [Candidatus Binatia bacterium]
MRDVVLRTIELAERDAVLDLLAEWYNDREFFARYLLHDPTFSPALCFVAEVEGRLVSTFQVFRKAVRLDGTCLDVAGVGNVFTTAAYRGKGIASRLLQYGLAQLPEHDFDVSLLFAVRLGFYARLGYHSHLRYLVFLAPGARPRLPERYRVRPFAAEDLPAVQAVYDTYCACRRGTTVRTSDYWRAQLRYAGNPGEEFLLATDADRVVAYARATGLLDFYVITEYGYAPGHRDALLQLLLQHYLEGIQQWPGVVAQLAHEPEVLEALRQHGIADHRIDDVFWMWRIVSPERLAEKLRTRPDALRPELLWREILPPESSVYWISDRF